MKERSHSSQEESSELSIIQVFNGAPVGALESAVFVAKKQISHRRVPL